MAPKHCQCVDEAAVNIKVQGVVWASVFWSPDDIPKLRMCFPKQWYHFTLLFPKSQSP